MRYKRQLQPLSDLDVPYRHLARETLGLAAWKAGDIKQAKRWYTMLSEDTQISSTARTRVDNMLTLLKEKDSDDDDADQKLEFGDTKEESKTGRL